MSDQSSRIPREQPVDVTGSLGIHIVGVGGPGMAPLAIILAGLSHTVSGSDVRKSLTTEAVSASGVTVSIGHHAELVEGVDLVVYSTAIPANNIELVRARELGIAVHHRSGVLAGLCQRFSTIGVAGTHGKSTTAALLTHMAIACGMDPSAIVGAQVDGLDAGARVGQSNIFVLEADESDGTLETLPLAHIIVTNIDVDHLDHFGTFANLQDTMTKVVSQVDGVVVMNADDLVSCGVANRLVGIYVRTFGYSETANVQICEVEPTLSGIHISFLISGTPHECTAPLRGKHNAMNVAAALAMVDALGGNIERALACLENFGGVSRRFTPRGKYQGALLVDDYAHLPAEIEAAIDAMRSHPEVTGKVVAVFQPNRFHRIASMYASYADCFVHADRVVITDIFSSGTVAIPGVTGELVWQSVRDAHPKSDVVWAPTRADVIKSVASYIGPGDGCISMGCGDIEFFPDELITGQL